MKYFFLILILSVATFAIPIDSLVTAWADRNALSADISQISISHIDTVIEDGIICIRKPNAIFRTESDLILYIDGKLYTHSAGSDVGMFSEMGDFVYSDIERLIGKLGAEFEIALESYDSGFTLGGSGGSGNIVSFAAELDRNFIPQKIQWNDVFDYTTIFIFNNVLLDDPGDVFTVPDSIEFIRQ